MSTADVTCNVSNTLRITQHSAYVRWITVSGNTKSEAGQLLLLGNAHTHHAMTSRSTNPSEIAEAATLGAQFAASQAVTWAGNDVIRTTTVRDLEQAMKRHLPATINGHDEHLAGRRHRRRPAANWTPYHVTSMTSSPLLPASDLLRTLHDAAVRRQQRSVICSSRHSQPYHATLHSD